MFTYSSISNYHSFLAENPDGCSIAVSHFLAKIKEKESLNAFLEVYAEEAIAKAKWLDDKRKTGKPLGKLHGVVIALKDVIAYTGHQLSASSKILENFRSIYNASAVEKLLEEEAIIIGRNNCDEFAMGSTNENSAFGNVLNAADQTRVPGGSSGGSAVAVQAGLCMASLGSDTGGSVRQPAGFCGIIGLKPTYGRISRYGLIAYASSFDQIGIFANNISDVAIVLEVIERPDDFDSTLSNAPARNYSSELIKTGKKFRIAYFKEAFDHASLDPEIREASYSLINRLEEDGHLTKAVDFKYLDYIVPTYYVLSTAEASSNLSRFDGVKYGYRTDLGSSDLTEFYKSTRSKAFGKEVKRRILLGTFVLSAGYYDAYFTRAQKIRKLLINKTNLIFNDFDLILLPTSPSTAFKIGEKKSDPIAMYLSDIYTVYANLTGIPAISFPLSTHTNGMPFGIQAMTNRFKELLLLQFSELLAQKYTSFQNPTSGN
ncbi:MAG: Asp-tRNA(Asn)/Glu-tRNA(Gln) amidotransferase subunit GatA [Bacteroidetes bacterium]|nr:Asp-tRNA(Asn)/Glu-tRNA(Gln) amidotransferase subunit GatA [Bacteroidota bacterium]MBS1973539.1 Asp-tRNA(Asn)/Glu-tRNA(Gln) amidotransferase subunit GatA [Bacteroidota bacterium]